MGLPGAYLLREPPPQQLTGYNRGVSWRTVGWSVLFSLLAFLLLLALIAFLGYVFASSLYQKYYAPLSLAFGLLGQASSFLSRVEGTAEEIGRALAEAFSKARPRLKEKAAALGQLLAAKLESLRQSPRQSLDEVNEKIVALFEGEEGKIEELLQKIDGYWREVVEKGRNVNRELDLAWDLSSWLRSKL